MILKPRVYKVDRDRDITEVSVTVNGGAFEGEREEPCSPGGVQLVAVGQLRTVRGQAAANGGTDVALTKCLTAFWRRSSGSSLLVSPGLRQRRRKWAGGDTHQRRHQRWSEDEEVLHGRCSGSLCVGARGLSLHL